MFEDIKINYQKNNTSCVLSLQHKTGHRMFSPLQTALTDAEKWSPCTTSSCTGFQNSLTYSLTKPICFTVFNLEKFKSTLLFPYKYNCIFYKIADFQDPNLKNKLKMSPFSSFLIFESFVYLFLKIHQHFKYMCMKILFVLMFICFLNR